MRTRDWSGTTDTMDEHAEVFGFGTATDMLHDARPALDDLNSRDSIEETKQRSGG